MNKKMYGDEVPSSSQHAESEPPAQHKTLWTKKTLRITPRAPRSTPEQPHHPHRKTPAHAETNPHRPKARQTTDELQKLICQTLHQWKPIHAHTKTPAPTPTPSTGNAANPVTPMPTPNAPRVSPYLPCTSTPKPARWKEDQNEGISSLTI